MITLMIDAVNVIDMRLRLIAAGKSTSDEIFLMVNETRCRILRSGRNFAVSESFSGTFPGSNGQWTLTLKSVSANAHTSSGKTAASPTSAPKHFGFKLSVSCRETRTQNALLRTLWYRNSRVR